MITQPPYNVSTICVLGLWHRSDFLKPRAPARVSSICMGESGIYAEGTCLFKVFGQRDSTHVLLAVLLLSISQRRHAQRRSRYMLIVQCWSIQSCSIHAVKMAVLLIIHFCLLSDVSNSFVARQRNDVVESWTFGLDTSESQESIRLRTDADCACRTVLF